MIKIDKKNFLIINNTNKFCEKCCRDYFEEKNKYYSKIISENDYSKIFLCPYGYSSILTEKNLYTGLIIDKYSNIKQIRNREKYNPKLKQEYTIYTELEIKNVIKLIEENNLKYEIYRSTIHDIKRASVCIREIISSINVDDLSIEIKNIIDGTELINTRLDYHDRLVMPNDDIARSFSYIKPCSIGKKISKLLEYKAFSKKIKIRSYGYPTICVKNDSKAIYVLFFVLIENAIKYSPVNSNIDIYYKDIENEKSFIEIKNECFDLTIDEINNLFKKGYRGKNAMNIPGNGLGMEVVKKIFEMCNIEYKLNIEEVYEKKYFIISFIVPSLK